MRDSDGSTCRLCLLGEWLWQPLQNARYICHLSTISVEWVLFGDGDGGVWLANLHNSIMRLDLKYTLVVVVVVAPTPPPTQEFLLEINVK